MKNAEAVPRLARPAEPFLVTELSRMFWASAVTRVAVRKQVFTILASGPLGADRIAESVGTDAIYTGRLLDACVALGLLTRKGGMYENSEAASRWLVEGSDSCQKNIVLHTTNLWQAWEHLEEAITTGKPVPHERSTTLPDELYWAQYMWSQHERAISVQQDLLLANVGLQGRKKLLDVGGGAGSYTIAMCQRYPELEAVVLDQEVALPVARRLIESAGLSPRVATLGADYKVDEFGGGYDVVLFSGVLCQEKPDVYSALLEKAWRSMEPGGLVIVQDIIRMEGEENDATLALYDLYLVLVYGHQGGVRSSEDVARSLSHAGFRNIRKVPLEGLFSILTAEK
jgi:predicted O-methyltransferase YrrM